MRKSLRGLKRKTTQHSFPVVVVREKREYWAYVPDLPGVYGRGKTAAGAKKDISGALAVYIEDCIDAGEPVPKSVARVVNVDTLSVAVGA
jgi:predicted RNase H-like HicB family nuclease